MNTIDGKGATLIEAMVALAIAAVIGAAMIAIILQAQAVATSARLKNQATRYAEEVLEKIKGRETCPLLFECQPTNSCLYYTDPNPPNLSEYRCLRNGKYGYNGIVVDPRGGACPQGTLIPLPSMPQPPCTAADFSRFGTTPFYGCYEITDNFNSSPPCTAGENVPAGVKKVTAIIKYQDRGSDKFVKISSYISDIK